MGPRDPNLKKIDEKILEAVSSEKLQLLIFIEQSLVDSEHLFS